MDSQRLSKAIALFATLGLIAGSAYSQQTTTIPVTVSRQGTGTVLITKEQVVLPDMGKTNDGELPANVFAGASSDDGASNTEAEDPEARKKAERQKKIQQLTFDRRPSAILSAWATPEGEPDTDEEAKETSKGSAAPAGDEAKAEPDKPTDEVAAALAEFDTQLKAFQRDVTLGRWDKVGDFIESLPDDEATALYKRLIQTLPNAPGPGSPQPIPGPSGMTAVVVSGPTNPQFQEKNTFNGVDMLALARDRAGRSGR